MHARADGPRSRATTFFRVVLAIPHLLWFALWGFAAYLVLPVHWLITLIRGRPAAGLAQLYEQYLRYSLHVTAYVMLAADPFPPFLGERGTYPIDVEIAPPAVQNRWSIAFRGLLALPAYVFAGALGSTLLTSAGTSYLSFSLGLAVAASLLAWFAILARGAMPAGLQDVLLWTLGYAVQATAYFFLLTGAYPSSDPRRAPLTPRPPHPVRLTGEDELRGNKI